MAKELAEQELREQAVRALSDSLGPVDALRFPCTCFSRALWLRAVAEGVFFALQRGSSEPPQRKTFLIIGFHHHFPLSRTSDLSFRRLGKSKNAVRTRP
jgi:hypothetical protein